MCVLESVLVCECECVHVCVGVRVSFGTLRGFRIFFGLNCLCRVGILFEKSLSVV